MPSVVFRTPVKHNGREYAIGAVVHLGDDEAEGLRAKGSVDVLPDPKPKPKAKAKAKKKAKVSDE